MSIKSAPFYWLVCDRCGERADYGEHVAMSHPGDALDLAVDSEWLVIGHPVNERHYCMDCTTWDDEGDERVPLPAEALNAPPSASPSSVEWMLPDWLQGLGGDAMIAIWIVIEVVPFEYELIVSVHQSMDTARAWAEEHPLPDGAFYEFTQARVKP
jgi:hypothetical protein